MDSDHIHPIFLLNYFQIYPSVLLSSQEGPLLFEKNLSSIFVTYILMVLV